MQRFVLRCRWRKESCAGLALLLFFAMWPLTAAADDAPAHRAARLSYLQGNVTIDHLDNTAGDPAQINMPLTEGARLSTGEDGQAEVEFEDGSVVRVTPNSAVGLNSMSIDAAGIFRTQLAVLHGLVYAELRTTAKSSYSVHVDGQIISPIANATIRINLDQPPAVVAVFDGTVHVEHTSSAETNGYKTDVHSGEALTGDASDGRFYLLQSIEQDSWDEWNKDRDQAAADAAATQTAARDGYAGDQGYGWSDLDANGSWYDVPGQGQVWQPAIAQDADFDPYGYGSWVAFSGAGYVWASGYSWGWTPFRCGSWSYWTSFGWGWSPGAGCRRVGWGFGGGTGRGGYAINVGHPPLNYRLPTRPVHEAGMLHPIPVGRAPREPGTGFRSSHEIRLIAGVPVEPLRPVGNASAQKTHSTTGASQRSDFSVDHTNRQPVSGTVAAPPATAARGDFRSAPPRSVSPPAPANGAEQTLSPMRPAAPPPQRSYYPAQGSGDHPASRSSAPAPIPHSVPAPSHPPVPHSVPTAPAPAAPKR